MKKEKIEVKEICNEPEFIILQDGSKIDLKKNNYVLIWDIGNDDIVTANFSKKNTQTTSNLLFRTSIACRLYSLGVEWSIALYLAVNQEQKAAAMIHNLLKDDKNKNGKH